MAWTTANKKVSSSHLGPDVSLQGVPESTQFFWGTKAAWYSADQAILSYDGVKKHVDSTSPALQ